MNEFAIVYMKNITGTATFKLYDLTGQQVMGKENLTDGNFVINTKTITAGFYLYTVGDESQTVSQGKLMIVH